MGEKIDTEAIFQRRRSLPAKLRYMAAALREGTDPAIVAAALDVVANEQDELNGNGKH